MWIIVRTHIGHLLQASERFIEQLGGGTLGSLGGLSEALDDGEDESGGLTQAEIEEWQHKNKIGAAEKDRGTPSHSKVG